jgi:hypothetical protein
MLSAAALVFKQFIIIPKLLIINDWQYNNKMNAAKSKVKC